MQGNERGCVLASAVVWGVMLGMVILIFYYLG